MSYQDTKTLGRSASVPFIAGEDPKERHARRAHEALIHVENATAKFSSIGVRLSVKNDGQHWIMTKGNKRAEWWPSSAKLVINQRWQRGIHAHDWTQVFSAVARMFKP